MKAMLYAALAGVLAATPCAVLAGMVVLEDGENFTAHSTWWYRDATHTPAPNAVVDTAAATGCSADDMFGLGTANAVVRLRGWKDHPAGHGMTVASYGATLADNTFATYEFELVAVTDKWQLRIGANSIWSTELWGSMPTGQNLADASELNKRITVSVLFNRSGTAQAFYNPITKQEESVADESWRVFKYRHDTGVYSELTTSRLAHTAPTRLWFFHAQESDTEEKTLVDTIRWNSGQLAVNGTEAPPSATVVILM